MAQNKIACQQYSWFTYLQREDKVWNADLDAFFELVKQSGYAYFEGAFDSLEDATNMSKAITKSEVSGRSLYVNSTLHIQEEIEQSIQSVLVQAKVVKKWGVEIIVTNPRPIEWGKPYDKSDEELVLQANALDRLGLELRKIGMQLAYHTHDTEMRQSAREFHHMLWNTDSENVKLCLDSQWIHLGSGLSNVALFDIVKMYMDRIVELHIRQSKDGIWTETFHEGEIDYPRLVETLLSAGKRPNLVMEQAVQEGTPNTISAVEAMRQNLENTLQIFKPLL
ncbi:MAG: sugar phosphate isomerase/epimerase [Cyclobacteriaceae bacterium]